jgi:predicted nucleic acid-binding protein
MKAFLDTSVLVAVFYADHEHHGPSFELFLRFKKSEVSCSAHSLAEVYSCLTGMPGKDRVSGDEALLFLGSIRERITVISLDSEEVFRAIETSSNAITGGGIYDALIGHCALKAKAETLYTWDLKDFRRLGQAIAARVGSPHL